ncbi:MAG: F0F1 ATP synthase subunit I' [Candidatus Desulfovibrio kirbyi]|uniref:F0F1 ATP synthase subunit I n=1 Tax=Candidatus Desulfovibrio kirbyi TaxID=2696086 RepID=A0A6L2R7E5_9BACT|nr:MAG: F0F1 ATP synthase subunit I' [Candidatus Desulfovibrio kirbyi]
MFAGSAALRGLDAWLCRRGITHPMVIPLVRNELLLMFVFLLAGSAFLSLTPWFFWFGVGIGVMALVFWGLARFFSAHGLYGIFHCPAVFRAIALGGKACPCGGRWRTLP